MDAEEYVTSIITVKRTGASFACSFLKKKIYVRRFLRTVLQSLGQTLKFVRNRPADVRFKGHLVLLCCVVVVA